MAQLNLKGRTYHLFLDDERDPPSSAAALLQNGIGLATVRNIVEAQEVVIEMGIPRFISFDHDLGENEPTGYDFARWLSEYIMDNDVPFVEFDWYVHSQNPVGADNINGFLANFLPVWKSGSWKDQDGR